MRITPRLIDYVSGWPNSTDKPRFSSEWAAGYAQRKIDRTMLPAKDPTIEPVCDLFFGDDLSFKEIARQYGKSLDWVRTRVAKGLRLIRGGLKREGFDFLALKQLVVYKEQFFLTVEQHRALVIVRNSGNISPKEFARIMWSGQPGSQYPRVGGSFLSRLERRGWLNCRSFSDRKDITMLYSLSQLGEAALDGWKSG